MPMRYLCLFAVVLPRQTCNCSKYRSFRVKNDNIVKKKYKPVTIPCVLVTFSSRPLIHRSQCFCRFPFVLPPTFSRQIDFGSFVIFLLIPVIFHYFLNNFLIIFTEILYDLHEFVVLV